MTAKLRPNNC